MELPSGVDPVVLSSDELQHGPGVPRPLGAGPEGNTNAPDQVFDSGIDPNAIDYTPGDEDDSHQPDAEDDPSSFDGDEDEGDGWWDGGEGGDRRDDGANDAEEAEPVPVPVPITPRRIDSARSVARALRDGGVTGATAVALSDQMQRNQAAAPERVRRWNNASFFKKVGLVACSAAGAFMLYRFGRPLLGDAIDAFHSASGGQPVWHDAPQPTTHTQDNVYVRQPGEEHSYYYPDHGLGEWEGNGSDKGTIEGQIRDYADRLGYDNLTPGQVHKLTGMSLEDMGKSWQDARNLSDDFVPDLPGASEMEHRLQELGVQKTGQRHGLEESTFYNYSTTCDPNASITADKADLAGQHVYYGPQTCAVPGAEDAAAVTGAKGAENDIAGIPFREFSHKIPFDPAIAAGLGGVLLASGIGTYALLSRRGRRNNADTVTLPVVPPAPMPVPAPEHTGRHSDQSQEDGDDQDGRGRPEGRQQGPVISEGAIRLAASAYAQQIGQGKCSGLLALRSRNEFFYNKVLAEIRRQNAAAAAAYDQYLAGGNSDDD